MRTRQVRRSWQPLAIALMALTSAPTLAAREDTENAAVGTPAWWLEQAHLELGAITDGVPQAWGGETIALALAHLGDFTAAKDMADRLDAATSAAGDERRFATRDKVLALMTVAQARKGEAKSLDATLERISEDRVATAVRVDCIRLLAEQGLIEEALELHDFPEGGFIRGSATASIVIAIADQGNLDGAYAVLDEVLHGTYAGDQVRAGLVEVESRAGRFDYAEALLADIADDALRLEAIGAIAAQRTFHDDSEGAKDFADRREDRMGQALALRAIGEAEFREGQISSAWATLSDAHLAAERIGDLEDRWRCCLEIGRTRRRIGDREGALASLVAALDALIPMSEPERLSERSTPEARITVSSPRAVTLALIAAEQARAGGGQLAAATMSYVGEGEMRDLALMRYAQGLADAGELETAEGEALKILDQQRRWATLHAIALSAASRAKSDLEALAAWMRSMNEPAARVAICAGAAEGLAQRPPAMPVQASRN